MQFKVERVTDIWDEIKPLLQMNFEETGVSAGIFSPSKRIYELLQDAKILHLTTARNKNGEVVGFSAFNINHHPHYENQLFATQDAFYVLPQHRGFSAMKFFAFVEQDLRSRGVNYVLRDSCDRNDWSKTLKKSGYSEIKTIFIRHLGE